MNLAGAQKKVGSLAFAKPAKPSGAGAGLDDN